MNKSRVAALTDGIIAIAATIMVLELEVPKEYSWSALVDVFPTFVAYLISFFMIYVVWYMHHNLFEKAEVFSRRAYMINGFWIFALTLVPFTTAWVGSSPNERVPEFLYALNMLIWSMLFQWLDHQIQKDNPGVEIDESNVMSNRVILYGTFIACMIISFIFPAVSMGLVGVNAVFIMFRLFVRRERKKEKAKKKES